MREHKGKEHPRRHDAGRFPVGARARPDPIKKPRGQTAAKKDFTDAANDRPPRLSREATPRHGPESGERIAKVMARAGLCSRREAEAWIGAGRVALNGVALTNPAVNVRRDDKIAIDGAPLAQRTRTRLFLFHKPRGLVTTTHDPQGRPAIFDYLREHWPEGPRVVSIGRLDINSEGLLLLTNDGGLARVLELPATGWVRRYRVRAKGKTDQAALDGLRDGVTVEGMKYAGIEASLDRVQGANSWLTMALREGKNREIKRVLEHIGLQVNRLIRLSFGPFQLGELAAGAVEEVRTRVLRDQLGAALTKAAGADFSSPLHAESEEAEISDVLAREPRNNAGPRRDRGDPRHGTRRPRAPGPRGNDRLPEARVEVKTKPAPRVRKHVSALRAEHDEPPKERKRIERRETADRSGRTVYVERLVSAKREDKHKPPDPRKGRRFEAGRQNRIDASERSARRAGGPAASSTATKDRTTEGAFRKTKQERWQKPPGAQKPSAPGTPYVNAGRAQRLAQPFRKFAEEGGRRTDGSPESRQPRDQSQGQKHHGARSPIRFEKPRGSGPPGGTKPPRRGGPSKGRPRGKS